MRKIALTIASIVLVSSAAQAQEATDPAVPPTAEAPASEPVPEPELPADTSVDAATDATSDVTSDAGPVTDDPVTADAETPPTPAEPANPVTAEVDTPATPADPAGPVTADAAPPATPAEPDAPVTADAGAATQVSDAEVESFAAATVKVQAISSDTSIADDQKQTQMAAAVQEAGIDPARYNEIGEALSSDEALRARVQTAMARHAGQSSDG